MNDHYRHIYTHRAAEHFVRWYGSRRSIEIDRAVQEIHRLTKPTGHIIIIETLTTGSQTPHPPTDGLAQYYHRLETRWGFHRSQIQTDYVFSSTKEAIAKMEFFFGPALAATIKEQGWTRVVPEWTGIWHKVAGQPASAPEEQSKRG